jgi:hypothetical protein
MRIKAFICFLIFLPAISSAQDWFTYPSGHETRWISFENKTAAKGKGAMENKGAKGNASQWVKPGEQMVLADFEGAGVINRIWMTIIDRNPQALRSIVIEMYWDDAEKPAVSLPLGDFFGIGLGRRTAFQSALFTDPEGKSFVCYIPMPFRKHAKVVFKNGSQQNQLLFYDIDLTKVKKQPKDMLYFHAIWRNSKDAGLGQDFEILPEVKGKGRFLGTNFSVIADKIYGDTWFGEGEVKMYLDGDSSHPTLAGTGLEDYIGTAWNLNAFSNLYQGCTVVDKAKKQYAFYRYHVPDPIWFSTGCKVTIQQMGGGGRDLIRNIIKAGGKAKAVSVMTKEGLVKLMENPSYPDIMDDRFPADEWTNFYRVDNYSATAYFYLDKPENNLPPLPDLAERLKGL